MASLRIGFIGAGNMAQALATGFLASGLAKATNIIASSPPADKALLDQMASHGIQTSFDNREVASNSDIMFVAVKPNILPSVLKGLANSLSGEGALVTSIALGVSLRDIESVLVPGTRTIRVMPNTPALVKSGASVFCKGSHATDNDAKTIASLLSSVGECDEVPETFLDAITGLSGAGPAYMYLVIEALADGGVKMGLPRPLALKLAAQTMMGSAKMVLSTGKPPGQLKDEVCSPGGCTIQGIAALENGGLRAALINAVDFAATKSINIANKN